jgi:hypothetical protein
MDRRIEVIRRIMESPGTEWEEWSDPTNEDLWETFQGTLVRLDTMIFFLKYLWPTFVEIDGLVLRESYIEWTPETWSRQYEYGNYGNLAPEQIEFLVNHLHLVDLFRNAPVHPDVDETVWRYFAESIADMWRSRLAFLFPDKRFDVVAWDGGNIGDWQVSAITIRDES